MASNRRRVMRPYGRRSSSSTLNRQAEFQRAKADHDFTTEAQELRGNTELTREIHSLTTEIHRHLIGDAAARD